jgi:hypothetical protein
MVVALPIALANTTPLPYVREKDRKREMNHMLCFQHSRTKVCNILKSHATSKKHVATS